jgi:hypothetical protein
MLMRWRFGLKKLAPPLCDRGQSINLKQSD